MFDQSHIRNFSIIAHIDHGKSTLADRLLELCNAVPAREMENQILDNMDLERERGITIKSRAVHLFYTAQDGETYALNLIDTPGHVDFNYEVSRSLAACEGAVLVVDATQGVEAQTLANTYLAMEHDLEILPVFNKIDLPAADPMKAKQEVEDIIGLPAMDAPEISAKQGINIQAVLEDIVQNIPAPSGDPKAPLQALVFDSQYDPYVGVVVYFRVKQGTLRKGQTIRMMATGAEYTILECGYLKPLGNEPTDALQAGEVGYFTASIKNVKDTQVGDTITGADDPADQPLPGYRPAQSMVYCGIYTEDGSKYPDLRDALEKLQLNDASLTFEPESSVAQGFGFRCGFLGMLHMEIIQERLEREFNLDLVTTLPSVIYHVYKSDGTMVKVDNPHNYPDPGTIEHAEEPYVRVSIIAPNEFVGNIMPMCQERRGEFKDMQYLDTHLVELHYQMPLNEIIYDFFDTLKANTKGYASLDYELSGYRTSDLVKVDLLLNGDGVDALSFIAHRDKAYPRARRLCEKLKENIPRQLFEVPIQAAIGGRIIARETVKAMRKDVLAKCYGGDITRKKKLLEKQKEGKKKMRNLGTVQVPTEAFMAVPQAGQRLMHPHRPNGSAPFGRTHLTFGKVHDMSELYELLTFEAFGQRYPELTSRHQILPGRGVFCKAERLQSGVIGTYAMPQRMAPTGEKHFFGYYLTEKKLLLVEKGSFLQGLLPGLPGETPAQLLSELLARLTAEDMESLQHYEERLTALEEVLLAQQAEDFDKKIFRIRRELSVLAGYYAQLDDLYAVLADAIPDAEEHVQRLLEHLSGKAQRLLTMTEQEKEYSLQLREMHQTQVDMRQNQIMKILTIVTTVFLPLSLIAGWYGMNFRNMPELTAEHGYLVICIVSAVCVLVELWIFKRKKWF